MIDYNPSQESERLRNLIGAELYERQRASRHLCVSRENGVFLAFFVCELTDWRKGEERICIYCTREQLSFFGGSQRCADLIAHLPQEADPFCALAQFFADLTAEDIDVLDRLEQEINRIEDALVSGERVSRTLSAAIVAKRRTLLQWKRYYDQLAILLDQIGENETHLLDKDALRLFSGLGRRVDRLGESVVHLRECVTQAREAYQAQIDIEQNQIMKIFTVITAVFLPLTLIAGWYGMNFQMPEYTWRLGYPYVVLLSAGVCAICFFLFKKKKWF